MKLNIFFFLPFVCSVCLYVCVCTYVCLTNILFFFFFFF